MPGKRDIFGTEKEDQKFALGLLYQTFRQVDISVSWHILA